MYYTTGFTKDQIVDLCAMVRAASQESAKCGWPPILGLYKSVVVSLTYLRRNRVQARTGRDLRSVPVHDQPGDHRADPDAGQGASRLRPGGRRPRRDTQYIVDGTLLPCWSWAGTGAVLRQAQDHRQERASRLPLNGGLAWISDPVDGSRHDSFCHQRIRGPGHFGPD